MTASVGTIGWKAHAALARSAGRWSPLPGFAKSAYRIASGEPIWVGVGDVAMHPRAVVLAVPADRMERMCMETIVPWRLAPLALDRDAARTLREGTMALAAQLLHIGAPQGFAAFLAGLRPAFTIDSGAPSVSALAHAIDDDDANAAHAAALPLLGLGPGLTPSGDDFVGTVLYARRLFGLTPGWTNAALRLIDAAQSRTHAISAALFRDLTEGQSFASLHRLAAALAAGAPALAAARNVAAIGHSSGWDMLAGFIVGATGSAALRIHYNKAEG